MTDSIEQTRQAGTDCKLTPEMIDAMTDFFWEWRGDNEDAAKFAEAPPDMAALYIGLHRIYVRLHLGMTV